MKNNKRMMMSIVWMIVGLALTAAGWAGIVDEFWSGMGSALLVVGILKMIRNFCLYRNREYREKIEIEEKDERNRYLRSQAWSWAGYLFILIAAVSIIVFRLIGREELSMAASYAVCLLMMLYWGAYMVLRKKY